MPWDSVQTDTIDNLIRRHEDTNEKHFLRIERDCRRLDFSPFSFYLSREMHVIEKDLDRGIFRLTWSRHVTEEEARQCRKQIESELPMLSPGFRLLADLSDLDEMDSDCIPEIRRIMDSFREAGVSRIVRVIPEPHKDIGLNILSYFRYGRSVDVQTYKTLPEALNALENS